MATVHNHLSLCQIKGDPIGLAKACHVWNLKDPECLLQELSLSVHQFNVDTPDVSKPQAI